MKNDIDISAETVRRPALRRDSDGEQATPRQTADRFSDALDRDASLVALEPEDAPSIQSDVQVDLRVPYPWRSHRSTTRYSRFGTGRKS